jgi:NAD(P)-dependent dehydrogenase (short-subunit alcohol dehydrogenase family)
MRVALVTGAGHGLGAAHAKALAAAGMRVVVNDAGVGWHGDGHEPTRADTIVAEIRAAGGEAISDLGDAGDWGDAERMVETAIGEFGQLDVLVCNAGIMRGTTAEEMTQADWDAVQHVHVSGTIAPAHFAIRHWRERGAGGRVITTGSRAGLFNSIGVASLAYATAKGAIHALTLSLAGELAPIGVTVNCVVPTANQQPERVSPLVVHLASERAANVTGAIFYCGYGILARVAEPAIVSRGAVDELDAWFAHELPDGAQPPGDPLTR